jgi:hypothetical protein
MRRSLASTAIPIAIIMLVLWSVGTFWFEAPGWFHGLLTAGVFLLIWGIISRPVAAPPTRKTNRPG